MEEKLYQDEVLNVSSADEYCLKGMKDEIKFGAISMFICSELVRAIKQNFFMQASQRNLRK